MRHCEKQRSYLTRLLITPILRLHSSLLHSTHDWRPDSESCPIPILLLRHHTSATTTDCNRSLKLSHRFDHPRFSSDTETKREVWLLRTWFGIASVNKLVSLTWNLWIAEKFSKICITLAYITLPRFVFRRRIDVDVRNCTGDLKWRDVLSHRRAGGGEGSHPQSRCLLWSLF